MPYTTHILRVSSTTYQSRGCDGRTASPAHLPYRGWLQRKPLKLVKKCLVNFQNIPVEAMARRRNDYSREDFPGENFGSMGSGMRVNGSSSSSSGGGGGGGADGFVSLSSFASMSFDDARRSMNPVLRHSQQEARLPNIIHIAEDNSARHINQRNVVRRQGATPPLMDSLFSGLGRAGLRVPAPLADSQSSRGLESARSTRSNFDEYEALGMLDEGIVKRGVSEQKIRSLRVGPIQRRVCHRAPSPIGA
jgi:hypothetical protein